MNPTNPVTLHRVRRQGNRGQSGNCRESVQCRESGNRGQRATGATELPGIESESGSERGKRSCNRHQSTGQAAHDEQKTETLVDRGSSQENQDESGYLYQTMTRLPAEARHQKTDGEHGG
jgi:hypothetical protein